MGFWNKKGKVTRLSLNTFKMPNKINKLTKWFELAFQFIFIQYQKIQMNQCKTEEEKIIKRQLQNIPKKHLERILNEATRKIQKEVKLIKQMTLSIARKTIKDSLFRLTSTTPGTQLVQQNQNKRTKGKMIKDIRTQETLESHTQIQDIRKVIGMENSNQIHTELHVQRQQIQNTRISTLNLTPGSQVPSTSNNVTLEEVLRTPLKPKENGDQIPFYHP